MNQNIFSPCDDFNDDINGKLTYTNIIDSIPKNYYKKPIENWEQDNKTEWRWRFLKYNNKKTIEISYLKPYSNKRMFFNKMGTWTNCEVSRIYDDCVFKECYYYASNK